MKRLFVLGFVFFMLFSVSASAALPKDVYGNEAELQTGSRFSYRVVSGEDGQLYRLWSYPDGTTSLTSYFVDADPVIYENYVVLYDDEGLGHVFFVDDPSKSYKLVYDSRGRIKGVEVDQNINPNQISSPVSGSVKASVPSLDSVIDELCNKYSISKQDLYFHLLKDILSSCE